MPSEKENGAGRILESNVFPQGENLRRRGWGLLVGYGYPTCGCFSGGLLFFQAASVSVIPAQAGIFFGVRQCGVFRRVPGFGRDTRLRGYDGG